MSTSQFCIQQRQQEQQQIKKILTFSFASSALLHGILVLALPQWSVESPKVEKPMELIIVNKPKPQPKPETKIEPKPIVEPKPKPELKPEPVKNETLPSPVKSPEPVKSETPPPPVKPPEPIEPQSTPPKLSTKRVLTSPTPAPSQPVISGAISDDNPTSSLNNNFKAANSTVEGSSDQGSSSGVPGAVAANSEPPRPQVSEEKGISCISNCEPEYPAALAGAEGSAGVKLTIDAQGNIIGAELVSPHSNSQLNRQALLAAREMKFSSPGNSSASVQVTINFTVAGSEYDRIARQKQKERERAEQEAARQRQLEEERAEQEAARQRQLEEERAAKARREQLERERQTESQPSQQSIPNNQTKPKPLPALETEPDDEMLQKFRERIEQHQQN